MRFFNLSEVHRAALAVALLLAAEGCRCSDSGSDEAAARTPPSGSSASFTSSRADTQTAKLGRNSEVELTLSSLTRTCVLGQRGLVLDLGADAAESRELFHLVREFPPSFSTRVGESFRKLTQRQTDFVFWLTEELRDFQFSGRFHGVDSKRLAIYLDGERLGSSALRHDVTAVVKIPAKTRVLSPGRHRLTLSISRRRGVSPSAEVSWVRLGPSATNNTDFPATRREIFSEVSIAKERFRSVILRPGASLRCPVWLPPHTTLKTQWGLWGAGRGDFEVVVHTSEGERIVAGSGRREKDEDRDFQDLNVDLSEFASKLIDLELWVPHSPLGARVAFATPKFSTKVEALVSSPRARRAIVIVMSGLGEGHSPPQAGENGLPFFNQLAREATFYPNYRGSTTSAMGVMATLMTGLAPWHHGVESSRSRLPAGLPTLAGALESRGGRSAFFSGVPAGFAELGLARGFEHSELILPQADFSATEPLRLAKAWLASRLSHSGPVLTVVQLRGAHPPFDVSRSDARELAPAEYGGDLSPRRAAIQLGEIRERRRRSHRRMPGEDWHRLAELQKAALLKQSAALGDFVAWLREQNAYDDTLFVVMGDVGAGERPTIPYSDRAPLDESYLAAPLLVKFPGRHLKAVHVEGNFAPRDVAATLLQGLGLDFSGMGDGLDLGATDATRRALLRPHIAYRNHAYSLLQGSALLRGSDGSPPRLCRPALDPECRSDRADLEVMASRAMWLSTWSELAGPLTRVKKSEIVEEKLELDNALTVWGVRRP